MADMTPPLPKIPSGLQQHLVDSLPPIPPTPPSPPAALLLNQPPSVRLSSSPASSPRIVESPFTRTQLIVPERGSAMANGNQPGANFLELQSSDDESEWEDDNGTRNFSEVESLANRVSGDIFEITSLGEDDEARGRWRDSEYLTALPPFNQISAHDSTTGDVGLGRRPLSEAHQMSLKRYSRVDVVHNRESPRSSILSNASSDVMLRPLKVSRQVSTNLDYSSSLRQSDSTVGHRRNQSEAKSIRENAILYVHDSTMQAHNRTLQALEAFQSSPSPPSTQLTFMEPTRPKGRSFAEQRGMRLLAPIHTEDLDRPPGLQSHFIKTPYPFSPKKEFPSPKTRPRRSETDVTPRTQRDIDNKKGIHVLGISPESKNAYDHRNRLERNIEAQGLILTQPQGFQPNTSAGQARNERWNSARSTASPRESVVWLSLKRNGRRPVGERLEQIVIPSNLVTEKKRALPSMDFKTHLRHISVDFDDEHFSRDLRAAYNKLAGPFLLRVLSARSLRFIQLGQVSAWSGSESSTLEEGNGGLLAARDGLAMLSRPSTPFTEHALMELYRRPKAGKAKYTWVHWARRVAASNRASPSYAQSHSHHESTDDEVLRNATTIQFVHDFSPLKILIVLALMLAAALAAALLYIFLGDSVWRGVEVGRERADKATPGMLVGLMIGGVEGAVFGAWVVGSWMWL